ncbi:hypothetical protein POL68_10405 [Stigmatella sp. ncwal1]|uniref:Secreted protein n=1 Tax=Stigmatella ashevillensis TaxID=2995309 RepID=A0ABT5D5E2_9BACT|nr:hypothetical protein [Stigmatella ashevillena]MDC0708877.1 hypothetical protein [Stigmatella ashevillena]
MKTRSMGHASSLRGKVTGLLVAFVLAGGSTAAQAGGSLLACPTGVGEMRFTPALRGAPQDANVSTVINYGSCWARRSLVRISATASSEDPFLGATCGTAQTHVPKQFTLTWDTGETSLLTLVYERTEMQGTTTVVTFRGPVTEGRFKGALATQAWAYSTLDMVNGCLLVGGLARTSALVALAID